MDIVSILSQHQLFFGILVYWIFSAAVSSMPDIKDTDSPGYIWLYRFLHTIAGNLTTAFGDKISAIAKAAGAAAANGTKLLIILLIPFMLVTSSCAGYRVHPNAINKFDSVTYDTLFEAQILILNGHDLVTQNKLPKGLLPALINMEKAYNIALPAYQFWHSSALINSTNASSMLDALNKDMTDLISAIASFKKGQ